MIDNVIKFNDEEQEIVYATSDEAKKEAIMRMKKLKIKDTAINGFEKGIVCYSHGFDLKPVTKDMQKLIDKYEKEYNCLIYYCIKQYFALFDDEDSLNFIFVNNEKTEWRLENQDIKENLVWAIVTSPCMEIGIITVRPCNGCLFRIG